MCVPLGIDYTISNKLQGQNTFEGHGLHDLDTGKANPYQEVICIMGETLEPLDDDGIIPCFGFGDRVVKDQGIFPLKKEVPLSLLQCILAFNLINYI